MDDTRKHDCKSSIGCDAENCRYNDEGRVCTASSIRVDGKRARCEDETCCKTFIEKASI